MSEGKLTSVYRHHPQPGRLTYVQEPSTGICAIHDDPVVALKEFDSLWAGRSPYQLFEHAPPMPKRPETTPQTDKLIGDDRATAFRRALMIRFHSDLVGTERRFSADAIVQAINEAWESTGKVDGPNK